MDIKILLLLLLILTQSAFGEFVDRSQSGTEYFRMFNYNKTEKHKRIMEVEKALVETSEILITYIKNNPDYRRPSKKYSSRNKIAMYLVYTSMLLMNNNNGAIEGIIPNDILESQLKLPIKERYELAERFLKFARYVEPNDERLEAWHSSNVLRMQKYNQGVVNDDILDWIVDMTKKSPVFHLFNALTMSSDYDFGEEREQILFETVELMNSTDSPCFPPIKFLRRGEAKKCNTTKKTPFAMQGTSVYMGDVYLKKAVNESSDEKLKQYLKQALSTYRRPKIFSPLKTRKWNLRRNLNKRINIVKKMRTGKKVSPDFFKSKSYLDIYTCTSCHQGGKAKRNLHIKLP